MIALIDARLPIERLAQDITALEKLLSSHEPLDESGPGGLQEFFTLRPSLLLLLSRVFFPTLNPASYLPECSILQEFRADYAIASKDRSKFVFIEFEHAKRDSIFVAKSISKSGRTYQWSRTFEHGFSQIVDWYFRLDDYHRTSKMEEHFGVDKMEYVGVLVLGRDHFLTEAGLMPRFEWRRKYIVINSRYLQCFTYDQLARVLRETYATLIGVDPV